MCRGMAERDVQRIQLDAFGSHHFGAGIVSVTLAGQMAREIHRAGFPKGRGRGWPKTARP